MKINSLAQLLMIATLTILTVNLAQANEAGTGDKVNCPGDYVVKTEGNGVAYCRSKTKVKRHRKPSTLGSLEEHYLMAYGSTDFAAYAVKCTSPGYQLKNVNNKGWCEKGSGSSIEYRYLVLANETSPIKPDKESAQLKCPSGWLLRPVGSYQLTCQQEQYLFKKPQ